MCFWTATAFRRAAPGAEGAAGRPRESQAPASGRVGYPPHGPARRVAYPAARRRLAFAVQLLPRLDGMVPPRSHGPWAVRQIDALKPSRRLGWARLAARVDSVLEPATWPYRHSEGGACCVASMCMDAHCCCVGCVPVPGTVPVCRRAGRARTLRPLATAPPAGYSWPCRPCLVPPLVASHSCYVTSAGSWSCR